MQTMPLTWTSETKGNASRIWTSIRLQESTLLTLPPTGHVARIGPNLVVVDDPEAIKRMWAVRSTYKKSSWYDAVRFDPSRDNIISLRDDNQHNALRAKMAAGVSRCVPIPLPAFTIHRVLTSNAHR